MLAKPLLSAFHHLDRLGVARVETIFDLLAVTLFIATAGLFFLRFRHENPPLGPYVLVALVCAVGNWLGNHGGGAAAVGLLIGGAFFTLHLASEPYREDSGEEAP